MEQWTLKSQNNGLTGIGCRKSADTIVGSSSFCILFQRQKVDFCYPVHYNWNTCICILNSGCRQSVIREPICKDICEEI